jgi:hypothetical protein
MTQNKARRTNEIDFLQLPWAQEAPGSNPGAPTTNSLNYLRLFLRGISTTIQLGNIWEQLICEHVHSVSLGAPTGVRINLQSCCHVRMSQLSLCNLERRSLGMQQRAMGMTERMPVDPLQASALACSTKRLFS